MLAAVTVVAALAPVAWADGGYVCDLAYPAFSAILPMLARSTGADNSSCYMVLAAIVGLIVILYSLVKIIEKVAEVRRTKLDDLAAREENLLAEKNLLDEAQRQLDKDRQSVTVLAQQKSNGFPWLAEAYSEYFLLQQVKEAERFASKRHPAVKSAERVKEIARDRRVVEQKLRVAQGIMEYWRDLFPFLDECLGDDVDEELLRKILSKNIEAPFRDVPDVGVDPVRLILNKLPEVEYRKLSSAERNQRALNWWLGKSKSRWEIGREYEKYIGQMHEAQGYVVYYQGILEGYEDLGRDLIAKRGKKTLVIQCKCWSTHKTIHEKHINQLFGTMIKYRIDNPGERVQGLLCTSTKVSEKGREFATHLKVALKEDFPLQDYPRIKCNVSKLKGEKIYHLPFDQMYDRTVIEPELGECYVWTVQEAENLGFRRAWKWHGSGNEATDT
jgi:hypothetical protein